MEEQISTYLEGSDILLYLTSADSLASKNCNKELAEALERDNKVIPIILEDCDWQAHQLSNFEVLPDKGKALDEWTSESKGWQNVVDGIRKTVQGMQKAKAEPPASEQEKRRLVTLLFEQANFLLMIGQFDQAIKAYSVVIESNPDDAEAYNNRGIAYSDKGDYDQAIADYDKAIELKPDDVKAYNNRGIIYAEKSEYKQAIADYDKAIKLKPDYAEAYNNRGNAYRKKGNYDQAIADFDEAIALKPDYAVAYSNRGIVYLLLQQWEQARKDLQTAQDKAVDIIALFHNVFGSVADFEQKTGITLPPDIAEMLTKD